MATPTAARALAGALPHRCGPAVARVVCVMCGRLLSARPRQRGNSGEKGSQKDCGCAGISMLQAGTTTLKSLRRIGLANIARIGSSDNASGFLSPLQRS
jgi:hypothetical protein